jgi:ATP-dependent Zn protease
MTTQTSLMAPAVVAHHEAGHAVANLVLGIPFKAVRIIAGGDDGKIGVPFKTNPWLGPRPQSNPGEFTDAEWAELSQSAEQWEAWKKKDNDGYAIVLLTGKAAQIEYAGSAKDEEANADYSIIEHVLPHCCQRLNELEQAATELVKAHWPAVQAIAAELLVRPELTPEEVEEIFRRSMPLVQIPKSTK